MRIYDKEKDTARVKEYRKNNPWAKTRSRIHNRCTDVNHHYFKKGIKNFLSTSDLKSLWFRDEAYLMSNPSIDRRDHNGDYTVDNCRYIELKRNVKGNGGLIICASCKTIKKLRALGFCESCYRKDHRKRIKSS